MSDFLEMLQYIVETCFYLKVQGDLMFACSFTDKDFSARKSRKDHPSKMKAADESVRVTKKSIYVWNGKVVLKKQEGSQKVTGDALK